MKTAEQFIREHSPIHDELLELIHNEHPIVFDIGSCEGLDSVRYQLLFPTASVYAFEPVTSNFEKIIANSEKYCEGKLKAFKLALSNTNGTATFHISSGKPGENPDGTDWEYGNKSSSLLEPHQHLNIYPWCQFDQTEEVKTITLLEFCVQQKILSIDLTHLDVQGAELLVLDGAGDFLNNISLIWMEVGNVELYKDQPLRKDVVKYMKSKGFRLIKHDGRYISGDQLYIHNDFLQTLPFSIQKKYIRASSLIFVDYIKERMLPVLRKVFKTRAR